MHYRKFHFFVFIAILLLSSSRSWSLDIKSEFDERFIRVRLKYDSQGHPERIGFCLQSSPTNCRQLGPHSDYSIQLLRQKKYKELGKMYGKSAATLGAGVFVGVEAGAVATFLPLVEVGLEGSALIAFLFGAPYTYFTMDLMWDYLTPYSNWEKARILRENVLADRDVFMNISDAVAALEEILYDLE